MTRLSEITVPIIYNNNDLIGVIDSEHHEKSFFTSTTTRKILNTIATLIANKNQIHRSGAITTATEAIEMYSMNSFQKQSWKHCVRWTSPLLF